MDKLIFLYLILFPFGKLTGIIPDLVIITLIILNRKKLKLNSLILVLIFSLTFSLSFFKLPDLIIGFLYLIRFISYLLLIQFKFNKKLMIDSLIAIGISVAIFGWIQYLLFPDLRALKMLGWDDHYFRLVSTFLDPAFTGIILVLTVILVIAKTIKQPNYKYMIMNIFLVVTILFTYSRSSYLSLLFSCVFLFWKFKKRFILSLSILFIALIPFLPNPGGEGVNLARTYSAVDKFINFKQGLLLVQKSPVFGIGFNNVCIATTGNFSSHSCSGLDNSLLFILATTGIVGLVVFIDFIYKVISNTKLDIYGWALMTSFIALFVHGMFTNTWFYNFVLGWVAILVAITRKNLRG